MKFTYVLPFFSVLFAMEPSQDPTLQCIEYLEHSSLSGARPEVEMVEGYLRTGADADKVGPLLMSFVDDSESCAYHNLLYPFYQFEYDHLFAYIKSGNLVNLSCCLRNVSAWMRHFGHPLVLFAAQHQGYDEENLIKYFEIFSANKILPSDMELHALHEIGCWKAADIFMTYSLHPDIRINDFIVPKLDKYLLACLEVKTSPAMDWYDSIPESRIGETKAAVMRNVIDNPKFDYHSNFWGTFKWEFNDIKLLVQAGKSKPLALVLDFCSKHKDEHPVVYKSIPIMHALIYVSIANYRAHPEDQGKVLSALLNYVTPTICEFSKAQSEQLPWIPLINEIERKLKAYGDISSIYDPEYVDTYVQTTFESGSRVDNRIVSIDYALALYLTKNVDHECQVIRQNMFHLTLRNSIVPCIRAGIQENLKCLSEQDIIKSILANSSFDEEDSDYIKAFNSILDQVDSIPASIVMKIVNGSNQQYWNCLDNKFSSLHWSFSSTQHHDNLELFNLLKLFISRGDLDHANQMIRSVEITPDFVDMCATAPHPDGILNFIRFFESHGIDVATFRTHCGATMLDYAFRNRDVEAIQYVLERGIDPNDQVVNHQTTLVHLKSFPSCFTGIYHEIYTLLIKYGAKEEDFLEHIRGIRDNCHPINWYPLQSFSVPEIFSGSEEAKEIFEVILDRPDNTAFLFEKWDWFSWEFQDLMEIIERGQANFLRNIFRFPESAFNFTVPLRFLHCLLHKSISLYEKSPETQLEIMRELFSGGIYSTTSEVEFAKSKGIQLWQFEDRLIDHAHLVLPVKQCKVVDYVQLTMGLGAKINGRIVEKLMSSSSRYEVDEFLRNFYSLRDDQDCEITTAFASLLTIDNSFYPSWRAERRNNIKCLFTHPNAKITICHQLVVNKDDKIMEKLITEYHIYPSSKTVYQMDKMGSFWKRLIIDHPHSIHCMRSQR